jgi:GNAT superfamily N-acetyltransferase
MSLYFEHLTHPTADEFDQIRQIIETNFAPFNQKPFAMITGGCQAGTVTILVARESAGGPIRAVATFTPLPGGLPTLYLGYFVVDQHRHSQGIGSAFFGDMAAFINQHFEHNALVWDVEGLGLDDPDHLDSRRVRFYERQGAHVVTSAATYRMPLDGDRELFPLRLMWLPLHGRTAGPDRPEVAAWLTAIFALFYPQHGALLAQIIAELGA